VNLSLTLCTAGAMLVLPAFASANSLSGNPTQPSVQTSSYCDQVQTGGVEPEFAAINPTAHSATTEDNEDGIYGWVRGSNRDSPRSGRTRRPRVRSNELGDPADRLCRNDRSGVGAAPGSQSDDIDLRRLANA
jgi:hypothetical protein